MYDKYNADASVIAVFDRIKYGMERSPCNSRPAIAAPRDMEVLLVGLDNSDLVLVMKHWLEHQAYVSHSFQENYSEMTIRGISDPFGARYQANWFAQL